MRRVQVDVEARGAHPHGGSHSLLYKESLASNRVASMLRHLQAAQVQIEEHLIECRAALSEGAFLEAEIDVRFSIDLAPSQIQNSRIKSLSYDFSDRVTFQRIGNTNYNYSDQLRFPELDTVSSATGYKLMTRQATLGIQFEMEEGGDRYEDRYGRLPERRSEVSIASQNFRDALLIRDKVSSTRFLGRLADIARVNNATDLTQRKFDAALNVFKSPFMSVR